MNKNEPIKWIDTVPFSGDPTYPVLLDIVECIKNQLVNKIELDFKIIPTYEHLVNLKLTGGSMRADYIDQYSPTQQLYHIGKLSYDISKLGENFGIIFHNPEYYDPVSKNFVKDLLLKSKITGLKVAIEGIKKNDSFAHFESHCYKYSNVPEENTKKDDSILNDLSKVVSLCPQGIPHHIAESLTNCLDCPEIYGDIYINNEKWYYLPKTLRKKIIKNIPISDRKKYHNKIFDLWDPSGWGFVRRGWHASCGMDTKRILQQHSEYVYGMKEIGKQFLYFQFSILLKLLRDVEINAEMCCAINAARLSSEIKIMRKNTYDISIKHYKRAIKLCNNIYLKTKFINELGLLYAHQKNALSLKEARSWYGYGLSLLNEIEKEQERLDAETLLLNGLALVEYREGNNDKALELELYSRRKISAYPQIKEWALPLINSNISKLMFKRFFDLDKAISYLQYNLDSPLSYVQEYTRIDLSKFFFDRSEYQKVIKLLSPLYEKNNLESANKEREMFGRFLFILSLLSLKKEFRAKNQVKELQILCDIFNSKGGKDLLEKITGTCNS
jgi:hypothetical protein